MGKLDIFIWGKSAKVIIYEKCIQEEHTKDDCKKLSRINHISCSCDY